MKKLDVSLQADEPLKTGLLRVADCLIKNAQDRIRNPTNDREKDLHFVRVMIKRLRAILRLIRPVISETAFDRENIRLRTAGRSLSAARDADVARQTLAKLPAPNKSERDAVAVALAGFSKNGTMEGDISKTMSQIEVDLEQTRRNLCRLRIPRRGWKAIEPG